jgi:hypothetical protein
MSCSALSGALWQRETVWRFYFDFALHLSINRYLESGCGLLESICRRANGGSVGWASKGGEKDVAHAKGPRGSRGGWRLWYLSLIPRLKLNAERNFCRGDESCDTSRTQRVRSQELERERTWEGTEEGEDGERKEGNWSGKRASLIVAFSDNSRRTF